MCFLSGNILYINGLSNMAWFSLKKYAFWQLNTHDRLDRQNHLHHWKTKK
jgi:hypothetical protein